MVVKSVLRIDVTKQRIQEAARQNAHKCAIAQAIVDADSDIAWASVDHNYVQFGRISDELRYRYRTPREAQVFITDFDNDRAPKPFRLDITTDMFISSRRRQMKQAESKVTTNRRRIVAKATGQPLVRVKLADVEAYEQETGESTVFESDGIGTVRPGTTRKRRRSTTATSTQPRTYAHRPTLREILAAVGEV